MKVRSKTFWKRKKDGFTIKVSRVRKDAVLFYPEKGGGQEQKLEKDTFLEMYEPMTKKREGN